MDEGCVGSEPADDEASGGGGSVYPGDSSLCEELLSVLLPPECVVRGEIVPALPPVAPVARGELVPMLPSPSSSLGVGLSSAPCPVTEAAAQEFESAIIDWDTLQIVDKLDDEGRLEFPSENQMYSSLGLKKEDETEEQEREGRCYVGSSSARKGCEDGLAAIPIFQHLPEKRLIFDRNNSVIEPSSLYPSMKEFRLTMQQYSIDKKFELVIEATDKIRYRGYCKSEDYPGV